MVSEGKPRQHGWFGVPYFRKPPFIKLDYPASLIGGNIPYSEAGPTVSVIRIVWMSIPSDGIVWAMIGFNPSPYFIICPCSFLAQYMKATFASKPYFACLQTLQRALHVQIIHGMGLNPVAHYPSISFLHSHKNCHFGWFSIFRPTPSETWTNCINHNNYNSPHTLKQGGFTMLTPTIVPKYNMSFWIAKRIRQPTSKHQSLGLNYLAKRVIARATLHFLRLRSQV